MPRRKGFIERRRALRELELTVGIAHGIEELERGVDRGGAAGLHVLPADDDAAPGQRTLAEFTLPGALRERAEALASGLGVGWEEVIARALAITNAAPLDVDAALAVANRWGLRATASALWVH